MLNTASLAFYLFKVLYWKQVSLWTSSKYQGDAGCIAVLFSNPLFHIYS